ncbi:MAG TPA: nicotinamide riboside transporter PnuC [Chitinophagales bacterium]|nr:nicotinamide riboside transporter PnuC [Chitinophagales bacterium]
MEAIRHFIESFLNATTPLEVTGFAFAALYAILASYEKAWCWPAAIVSTGIFTYMCYLDNIKLQAVLQLFYLVMAFYGWYEWTFGKRNTQPLRIISFPAKKILRMIIIGIPFVIAGGLIDSYYDASLPWLDSIITVYSLIATWMVARKVLENWLFWIVIDPLSIWLFAARGRLLIGLLFLIYTLIAIFGYYKWRRLMQRQAAASS